MLKDKFYLIDNQEVTGDLTWQYRVRFNVAHPIFKAHFPKQPIVPGACLVQMCQELISEHFAKKIKLNEIANIKFIRLIQPLENQVVNFIFEQKTNNKLFITIADEETIFTTIKLHLTI